MSLHRIQNTTRRVARGAMGALLLLGACASANPSSSDGRDSSDDEIVDNADETGDEAVTAKPRTPTSTLSQQDTGTPSVDDATRDDAPGATPDDTATTPDAPTADTGDCPADAICRDEAPSKSSSDPGKYTVKTYDIARSGEHGGGTVYYPEGVEKFSGAVYCPPLTGSRMMYAGWGRFLASHGIAMVAMDTRSTQDSVQSRGGQLAAMVKQFKGEATRSGSALSGKLDATRIGTMGWSMGGGATWIAAAKDPTLKSSISMAGHNATGGGAGNSRGTKVPSMQLAGQNDTGILGGMGQSQGVYGIIPAETPKVLFVARGVGHMSWGGPKAGSPQSGELTLAFQKTYLDGDTRWKKFLTKPSNASEWKSNINP